MVAVASLVEVQVAVGKKDINTKLIESAVHEAEQGHHGEILPLILKQSDFYPAAHFRSALFFAIFTPLIMYYLPIHIADPIWYLWGQIPALLIGYLLAYTDIFKRLFSTSAEFNEEVHQKAVESFMNYNLHKTKKDAGVLIMISLLEHRVKILADHGFDEIMNEKDWKALTNGLASEIKNNKLNEGLRDTIFEVGKIMLKNFPLSDNEKYTNEIPNTTES